jgi:hypothetical protein
MVNKSLRHWDDWNDFKNEAFLEEELDDEAVNFDQRYEDNEIELE